MLDQALRVVEAARAMGLVNDGRVTRSTLDKLPLARAIGGLWEALEAFDRETGRGFGSPGGPGGVPAYHARPDFATPPQLDDRAFAARQDAIDMRAALPGMVPVPDDAPEPETSPVSPPARPSTVSTSPASVLSIPASSWPEAKAFLDEAADLGDGALFDGAENVGDFLLSLDAISDKLEYAVAKVGWTPRLRALAEAANVARNKMFLEVAEDGYFVRVPAESWGSLSVAMADAVSDFDNRMSVPHIRPPNAPGVDNEESLKHKFPAPKPPGY